VRRIAVVVVLVLAGAVWPAASGVARNPATTQAAAARSLQADFNNDGFADLAVAVPFEDVGTIPDAGAVHVLDGTPTGLGAAGGQLLTQDSPGVPGIAEVDFFAEGLTAADFDGDGFDDLAVGIPGEDVGAVMEAGAANVTYGAAGGLTATGSQLFTQDTPGIPDTAEANDLFALGLAASGPQRATAPPASPTSRPSPRPAPADR
jgi:FG-GAP repeat